MNARGGMSGARAGFALARFHGATYVGGGLVWIAFYATPLVTGLVLQALFDGISGGRAADADAIVWLCAALIVVEGLRGGLLWAMLNVWPYWWNSIETLLRGNVLRSILTAPGPVASRLPGSSGEAVSRFRDDVQDLVSMTDLGVDVLGSAVFATVAMAIMWRVDPGITLVLAVPMFVAVVATRLLSKLIRRWHVAARHLGAQVTAFVGDVFTGVLAVKTSDAERDTLLRLRQRNDARLRAAVRDRLTLDLLDTVTASTADISVALVLLLAAGAMRSGEFTVGDLALFTSYVGWLTTLPRFVGRLLYRLNQGGVAIDRLHRLMADHEPPDAVVAHHPVYLRSDPPALPAPPSIDRHGLQQLDVAGLTVRHSDGTRGVDDISFRVQRGSFTVITGAVGAGKTTLVRALLGLLGSEHGTVSWNGRPLADPGSVLVPPRVAYIGQIPRLLADTLDENLRLGWPATEQAVENAVHMAVFDRDVARMPDGLATLVGPRGIRLSGGQVQRATTARALVRTPDLLVVDDVSSALDVETEDLLWARLSDGALDRTGPRTLLVVSHRRAALERADQVIVLDRGSLVGSGPLAEVLDSTPEMRRLWSEELVLEAEELTG